uniref:Uncharacterized protein n=1 Tax=Panagrolaimus davidi TaxID=227884 RepID=A0A914Q2W9_9BILA
MSLSVLSRIAPSKAIIRPQLIAYRFASATHVPSKTSPKQLQVDSKIPGYFSYERDVSRDKRAPNPQKLGDTPMRFLLRRLGHAYEIYPLIFLTGAWFVVFCYVVYYSFEKVEIWLDRSQQTAPWDWSRIRNNYWKKPTLIFDRSGATHQRLEIMEQLQDEMLEAAKKRGTR